MLINLPALIIRENEYGESDKILTVLTAANGKLTVTAKGIRNIKNRSMAAAQLLCYSELTLYKKGDRFWLREASLIEQFFEIRQDLSRYALALYIADVANEICTENSDESDMLSLMLNTLYMLALGKIPSEQIKAVFELRAASLTGFMPNLSGCSECGTGFHDRMYLDVMNGVLFCGGCFGQDGNSVPVYDTGTATIVIPLDRDVLEAMRYTVSISPKRIFLFSLSEEALKDFASACEKYLLNHIERSFQTLDFYHEMKNK